MNTSLLTNLIADTTAVLKTASIATKAPQAQVHAGQPLSTENSAALNNTADKSKTQLPQEFAEILFLNIKPDNSPNPKSNNNLQPAFQTKAKKSETKEPQLNFSQLYPNQNLLNPIINNDLTPSTAVSASPATASQSAQPLPNLLPGILTAVPIAAKIENIPAAVTTVLQNSYAPVTNSPQNKNSELIPLTPNEIFTKANPQNLQNSAENLVLDSAPQKAVKINQPAIIINPKAQPLTNNTVMIDNPAVTSPIQTIPADITTPDTVPQLSSKNNDSIQCPNPSAQNAQVPSHLDAVAQNSLSDVIEKDLNTAKIQITTAVFQGQDKQNTAGISDSNPAQILANSNFSNPQVEQQIEFESPANNLDNAAKSVSSQIQGSIASTLHQGDNQVTINLNPPELGRVSIRFQEKGQQIAGVLEVSNIQTKAQIEQSLPQIIQNLQDSGIHIRKLEVVLADQAGQQTYKDPSMAAGYDSGPNHQQSANHDWQGNSQGFIRYDSLQEHHTGFDNSAKAVENYVGSGALNLLA